MSDTNKLGVWTNGYDWYVARSPEHVLELMEKHEGEAFTAGADPLEVATMLSVWRREPDCKVFSITPSDDPNDIYTKTMAELAEHNGPRFLASTEW